jgi:hypothetical protein
MLCAAQDLKCAIVTRGPPIRGRGDDQGVNFEPARETDAVSAHRTMVTDPTWLSRALALAALRRKRSARDPSLSHPFTRTPSR